MEKKIRSDLLKMYAMMLVLVGLGIYAHEFVIAGIKAKVALNSSIFAIFALAAYCAFRPVWNLKNEVIALKALQIDYGQRSRRPLDPYRQPAIVFHEPELLGQGYRMITEELGKQADLHISNATVQTLLHDVDQRINDRKSTVIYFSGLMVFLGLLGAFMGLMKTVHSVSDLIGSMDVSGKGGTDSFGKMIEGMKAPLNGMSVGFSSSLFGLMTSMVLGALERCMTSAMKTLRNEFEHWLSNVAELENSSEGASAVSVDTTNIVKAIELGGKHLRDLRETVLDTGMAQMETQRSLSMMAEAVTNLSRSVDKVTDPEPLLKPIADIVAELARNQTMMVGQFHGLINMAERDRTTIRDMLDQMGATIDHHRGLNGPQMHAQLDKIANLQSAILDQEPVVINVPGQAAASVRSRSMFSYIRAWLPGFGNGDLDNAGERRKMQREMAKMMASQRKLMRRIERSFGTSVGKIEAGRKRDQDLLAQLMSRNELNQARLTTLMDRLQLLDEGEATDEHAKGLLEGLHGARLEMDVLRRRMHLMQEAEGESENNKMEAARGAPDDSGDLPATGTDKG